ncbi:hypothetical protein [Spongiactinospora sp. 9N601]|uniref:hypothetical protein n=1 Tax=Spongiactinospora sp. 9N601 TaxID=3375149 RepID=UPI003789DC7F
MRRPLDRRRHVHVLMLAVLGAGYAATAACSAGQQAPQAQGPAAAPASPTQTGSPSPDATGAKSIRLKGQGTFVPFAEGENAVVYDEKLVPSGAKGEVTVASKGEGTASELSVDGLLPDRQYGAHLHVNPCGENPDDSGPHFRGQEATGTPTSTAGPEESPTGSPDESPTGSPTNGPQGFAASPTSGPTNGPTDSPTGAPTDTMAPSPNGTATAQNPANPVNEVWLDLKTNSEGDAEAKSKQPWTLSETRLPGSLVIHAKPTTTEGPQAGEAGERVACLTLTRAPNNNND